MSGRNYVRDHTREVSESHAESIPRTEKRNRQVARRSLIRQFMTLISITGSLIVCGFYRRAYFISYQMNNDITGHVMGAAHLEPRTEAGGGGGGTGANVSPQYKSVPVEFGDPFRLLNNDDGGPVRELFFSPSS